MRLTRCASWVATLPQSFGLRGLREAALLGLASGAFACSSSSAEPDPIESSELGNSPSEDDVDGNTSDDMGSAAGPDLNAAQTCNLEGAAGAETPTVWVIGDSTASVYASDVYPRMGWAQPLQDYFAPACAKALDMARSGRSSKSFYDEGLWTPVRDALRSGDFVLIQFGHNDEKTDDPLRFTDPSTTFKDYLSIFIDDALAKQATPILLTPIHRNNWSGNEIRDTHGAYSVAIRELAAARQLALLDASLLTEQHFESLGPAATTALFMELAAGQFPNYPEGNSDNTHLQEGGARTVADLILADAASQGLAVGQLVKMVPVVALPTVSPP